LPRLALVGRDLSQQLGTLGLERLAFVERARHR